MLRHVTIFTEDNVPLANGILLSEDWVLTIGNNFKSSRSSKLKVRIGRSKRSRDIVSIIRHPLVAMNIQQYNVAVVKLSPLKKGKPTQIPCFLTYKQFASLSKIVPQVMVTTRISGKKLFSKLKPKKGKLSAKCKSEDFICAKIKNSKKNDKQVNMLINGAPMYLGKSGNARLAGIGIDVDLTRDFEYDFIPIWVVSDWVTDVMREYDDKCTVDNSGNSHCSGLRLPTLSDMMLKLQPMEQH